MDHVFHRQTHHPLPVVVAGDGPYLIDNQGKRYLDGSGGAAVSCLGHSHPAVIAAIQEQVGKLAYAHSGFFTSEPAEALADALIEAAPPGLDRVYLVSGGSEAMEACLKLARQYFVERGEPQRRHIIARHQSYHGNTLGALAIGGNQWRRAQFEPLLIQGHHIAPCYAYRFQHPGESDSDYGQRAADQLEAKIQALGPESVIAFCCETVVGATAGAIPPAPGYLKRIREICDRHGILLILDEVMCGMGRTGYSYACAEDDVSPDLIAIAKGLGAGYQPVGAMLASGEIYATISQGSGFFQHGHTYMGHTSCCAAALAVQRVIAEEDLLANVQRQGEYLRTCLAERFQDMDIVGDIRGRGLFVGVELVADPETKEPLNPALQIHTVIKEAAMQRGLMCYPMGGTIDGQRGNHILLAPPFIINRSHVDELVDKLGAVVEESLNGVAVA